MGGGDGSGRVGIGGGGGLGSGDAGGGDGGGMGGESGGGGATASSPLPPCRICAADMELTGTPAAIENAAVPEDVRLITLSIGLTPLTVAF